MLLIYILNVKTMVNLRLNLTFTFFQNIYGVTIDFRIQEKAQMQECFSAKKRFEARIKEQVH